MNAQRFVLLLVLIPMMLVGSSIVTAAPLSQASSKENPPSEQVVGRTGSLLCPGLLDREQSRWDYIAAGGGGAYGFNVFIHLFTHHWRNVRITAAEFMFSFNGLESSFDWHLGPTVGFGGHHGVRQSFSHWFLIGTWYGQMHPISFADVPTTYRGIFLMTGYEFRLHFGRHLDWLFGIRLFGVYSPLGRNQTGSCRCVEGSWFCDCEPFPEDRIRYPLTFGISAFFGY